MGSFNVACGISNLSINEGDEVGFVILGQSIKTRYGKRENGHSCFVYSTDLHEPFLPPVYGKYDDYGNITEVQESLTTKIIENMFHKPVEVVLNCISSDRSVYSSHGDIFNQYFTAAKAWNEWDLVSHENLLSLGFTQDEQYDNSYSFGGYSLVIKDGGEENQPTSGGWFVLDKSGKNVLTKGSMHNDISGVLNEFSRVTAQYPGFDANDFDAIRMLNDFDGMFFLKEVYDDMKGYVLEDSYEKTLHERRGEAWDELMSKMNEFGDGKLTLEQSAGMFRFADYILRDISFPWNQCDELRVYGSSHDFLELHNLISLMQTLNRMLMPTMCGVPYGDNVASHRLNMVSEKIVTRRLDESDLD